MKLYFASALFLVGSCSTLRHSEQIENLENSIVFKNPETVVQFSNSITSDDLKTHLYEISSDEYKGRRTGEAGHNKASQYVKDYYIREGLTSPKQINDYYQTIPKSYFSDDLNASQNVIAFIEGSTYPDEVLVISGHLDHLGIEDNEIHNGADDNGSGTSALLEIAQAFQLASKNGFRSKRSIAFIHFTGEEEGLKGSRYYAEHPVFDFKNTVSNLNIDMIGRTDRLHEENDKYIYIIGADRISTELHFISKRANEQFTQLNLDYKYNAKNDSNRYYSRSDHYNFASKGVPVIFYFNGVHDDYHEATDTADKINFSLLEQRAKLIFATAWYIANSDKRLSAVKI
jgi:Zn-dependent M28 family amino/carboxypeptidase